MKNHSSNITDLAKRDSEISSQYKRASFALMGKAPSPATFFPLKDDENYLASLLSDPLLQNLAKPIKKEF